MSTIESGDRIIYNNDVGILYSLLVGKLDHNSITQLKNFFDHTSDCFGFS